MFKKQVFEYNPKKQEYTWKPQTLKEWVYYYRYKIGYLFMPYSYQVWLDELNDYICSAALEEDAVIKIKDK